MTDFRDDLRKFEQRFKVSLNKLLTASFINQLGLEVKDTIYKRVKSGYGSQRGQKTKLKALSAAYVLQRKGTVSFTTKDGKEVNFKIKKPTLGKFASAQRSNLTKTGQMLDSIAFKVTKNGVTVYIPSSKRDDSALTNSEIAKINQENGRNFFELTDDEVRKVQRIITNKLREIAKEV